MKGGTCAVFAASKCTSCFNSGTLVCCCCGKHVERSQQGLWCDQRDACVKKLLLLTRGDTLCWSCTHVCIQCMPRHSCSLASCLFGAMQLWLWCAVCMHACMHVLASGHKHSYAGVPPPPKSI